MPRARGNRPIKPWHTVENAKQYLRYLIVSYKEKYGRYPSKGPLMSATHRWPDYLIDEAFLELAYIEPIEIAEVVHPLPTGGRRIEWAPTSSFQTEKASVVTTAGSTLAPKRTMSKPPIVLRGQRRELTQLVEQIKRTHAQILDPCDETQWPCTAMHMALRVEAALDAPE